MKIRAKNKIFEAYQYSTPASVEKIMDVFGTTAINNSPDGLYFYDDVIPKGCWLIKGNGKMVHIMYDDAFHELFEVV